MSPEQKMTVAALSRLSRELRGDLAALRLRHGEVRESLVRWGDHPDKTIVTFGAVAVHAWYTGLGALLQNAPVGEHGTGGRFLCQQDLI